MLSSLKSLVQDPRGILNVNQKNQVWLSNFLLGSDQLSSGTTQLADKVNRSRHIYTSIARFTTPLRKYRVVNTKQL